MKFGLKKIRGLTTEPPEIFVTEMQKLCSNAGVAVAFVKELPGCRICGVSRWLSPTKAVIQLSLRYKTDDHLWFTFFHEAGHIIKGGKREIFIDLAKINIQEKKEQEANKFASDFLIPPSAYKKLLGQNGYTDHYIEQTSHELKISPGIIVGRLQHDGIIPYASKLNTLKKHFIWSSDERN